MSKSKPVRGIDFPGVAVPDLADAKPLFVGIKRSGKAFAGPQPSLTVPL